MFPILPSTGMQVEAYRAHYAPDNEEAFALKQGRVIRPSGLPGFQRSITAATSHAGGDARLPSGSLRPVGARTGENSLSTPKPAFKTRI